MFMSKDTNEIDQCHVAVLHTFFLTTTQKPEVKHLDTYSYHWPYINLFARIKERAAPVLN
jgi:hypothetical protein